MGYKLSHPLIGILGGMGPLASAGFVNFLYQKCRSKFFEEQEYPRIILISDPTIPDRMDCFYNNNAKELISIFENEIQRLLLLGANHILVCCFTAHCFLPSLTEKSQKSVIHLGKLLKSYLDKTKKNTLILCSKLLADSRLIDSVYAVYPENTHFDRIHKLIYYTKLHGPTLYKDELITLVQWLSKLYNVSQVLLACTEFHLIYQDIGFAFPEHHEIRLLDGLNVAADFIIRGDFKYG